jgi:hypothetical protein
VLPYRGAGARPPAAAERLGFDEYDIARQGLVSHHYRLVEGRLEPSSVPFRRDDAHAGVPGLAHAGQQDFVRDHNAITASLRSTRTGPIDEAADGSIC